MSLLPILYNTAFIFQSLMPSEEEISKEEERIINDYRNCLLLPRKQKKKLKKQLQIEYSMNQYAKKQLLFQF